MSRLAGVRRLIVAALLLLASACHGGQTPTGPSSNGLRIAGRVLDFGTGAGVPGAVVRFTERYFGDTQATTDATGGYLMSVPVAGAYTYFVDGAYVGDGFVHGPSFRGDLMIRGGTCISRYGTLTDARRLRPVAGATVTLGGTNTTSGSDGWYRIDLGCPEVNLSFNTAFIYVTDPRYAPFQRVVGRGIHGMSRIDPVLEPR